MITSIFWTNGEFISPELLGLIVVGIFVVGAFCAKFVNVNKAK